MKRIKLEQMTIDQLLECFAEIGVAQDEALFHDQCSKFNRLYDQMDRTERELRSRGLDARRSLMRLYNHPNFQVRLNAAKRTLAIEPVAARRIIQDIADSKLYPQAGDAGMCLSNLDHGTFKPQ